MVYFNLLHFIFFKSKTKSSEFAQSHPVSQVHACSTCADDSGSCKSILPPPSISADERLDYYQQKDTLLLWGLT